MDAYNNKFKLIVPNPKEKMIYNKVYVNPNFNKSPSCNYIIPDNGATCVSPKYSYTVPSVDYKHTISSKIYINPSFIRTTHPKIPISETSTLHSNSVTNISSYENLVNNYQQDLKSDNTLSNIVKNKSRYSFVRFNKTECTNVTVMKKPSNTIKVSKHKLIPLNNMKNIIATTKYSENTSSKNINDSPPILKQNIVRPVINMSRSSHKFIKFKPSLGTELVANRCNYNEVSRITNKKDNSLLKTKIRKGLKKNNIPCPLFKKFGKCMRLVHSHCDFLHDKKHVSICRKFLKGACHNNNCLLSHDLTMKKMPTCYFYLQGMCNKKDCPYLHIKLSEKSKVCPDFMKGYCEKGKKCLNRHVNVTFNSTDKIINTNKQICNNKFNTQSTNNKKNCLPNKYNINKQKADENKQVIDSKGHTTEYRYYQDLNEETPTEKGICEVIKPSRCKLGALPSFIQL